MKHLGKRIGAVVLAMVLSVGLCASGVFAAEGYVDVTMTLNGRQSTARECLNSINEFRDNPENQWYWNSTNTEKVQVSGLVDLVYDYDLEKVAEQRALEIAIQFDHTRPNGTICWTAYSEYSYPYSTAGENIAYGSRGYFPNGDSIIDFFAETNENYAGQGHRRNMLDTSFTNIGMACVTINGMDYWVMELSSTYRNTDTDTDPAGTDGTITGTVNVPASSVDGVGFTDNIELPESTTVDLAVDTTVASDTLYGGISCQIDMNWQSSDETIAAVDENGTVEGVAPGHAVITGTSGAGDVTYNVTVKEHDWTIYYHWDEEEPLMWYAFYCPDCEQFYGWYEATVIRDEEYDEPATCEHGEYTGYLGFFVYGEDDDWFASVAQYEDEDTILPHEYGEPVFNWSDDYTACTAVFTCVNCGNSVSEACRVTRTETDCIATVEFEGMEYSDVKENAAINGFAKDGNNWYYYVNGQIDTSCNSVIYGTVNGQDGWWYVAGGQVQLNYTGVCNYSNEYGWWYVVNGKVDFDKIGIEPNNYGWWRVVNGKVDFSCNSVEQNDYGWWYIVGGQVQFGYTGVANYANAYGWWYIENGKVNFNKTGIEPNNYGWWRVVDSKVDFSCNSVEQNDYGWWYIIGGQVQFGYTGVANYANDYGWWYINCGKVDFSITSVEQNNYGWWRVENGKVDFSFNGWARNSYGTWYCVNGKVDFSRS